MHILYKTVCTFVPISMGVVTDRGLRDIQRSSLLFAQQYTILFKNSKWGLELLRIDVIMSEFISVLFPLRPEIDT
jgi:hypothetical protein